MWREKNSKQKISILELIKRRSKVEEKIMPCERPLNFDQWETFPENYKSECPNECISLKISYWRLKYVEM